MKLYTEEQVKSLLIRHLNYFPFISVDEQKYIKSMEDCVKEVLEEVTPIELPSDEEVWRWWQTQKFQKEQGEQEYTMLYEIDLPKILKAFIEHLIQGGNNGKNNSN